MDFSISLGADSVCKYIIDANKAYFCGIGIRVNNGGNKLREHK